MKLTEIMPKQQSPTEKPKKEPKGKTQSKAVKEEPGSAKGKGKNSRGGRKRKSDESRQETCFWTLVILIALLQFQTSPARSCCIKVFCIGLLLQGYLRQGSLHQGFLHQVFLHQDYLHQVFLHSGFLHSLTSGPLCANSAAGQC